MRRFRGKAFWRITGCFLLVGGAAGIWLASGENTSAEPHGQTQEQSGSRPQGQSQAQQQPNQPAQSGQSGNGQAGIGQPGNGQPGNGQPNGQSGTPVQVASATRGDVPVLLEGIGTVQAYNTVTVRSRVDGALEQVLYREGQTVHVGDVLVRIDPRPYQAALDAAVAKRAQDQAQLVNAQLNLGRYAELARQDFASRQQLDTQRATVAQFQAAIQGDDAQIENARTQLGYATIASPINGITGIRLVDQGNIVHANDQSGLVVLTQIQPISVIFTLPAASIPEIRRAMQGGPLQVNALERGTQRPLAQGQLELVDNQIDQSTGTAKLKAIFENRDTALWPGLFVRAQLRLRTDHDAITIPSAAIQRGQDGQYVFAVQPDHTVKPQKVTVDRYVNGQAVITQGMQAGTEVVTSGQYRLHAGARIQVARNAPGSTGGAEDHDAGRRPPGGPVGAGGGDSTNPQAGPGGGPDTDTSNGG